MHLNPCDGIDKTLMKREQIKRYAQKERKRQIYEKLRSVKVTNINKTINYRSFSTPYFPNSCYATVPKQGTVTACDHMNLWAHFSIQPKWIQVSAGEYFLYLHNSSGNSSIFTRHNSCFTAKGCLKK